MRNAASPSRVVERYRIGKRAVLLAVIARWHIYGLRACVRYYFLPPE
jgi:hypothetical protein